ncbi:MAG: response regulator, partial [Bdellovibrionales bacterium]|nr:response regulator [Bdellovibrionales bacterium]
EKGEVEFSIKLNKEINSDVYIDFLVQDTGIGIDSSKIHLIFNNFQQADSYLTRKYSGNGVGLAVTKKLIHLMQGDITCSSQLGIGSQFKFTLKFTLPDLLNKNYLLTECLTNCSMTKQKEESQWHGVLQNLNSQLKVLLAEDSLDNQYIVNLYLRDSAIELSTVDNGQQAVDFFKKNKYDLILMDIQMPLMDGYSATREIRKIKKQKQLDPTPILALTAHALKTDKEQCIAAGCDDFITKPYTRNILIGKIASFFKNKKNTETEQNEMDSIMDEIKALRPTFLRNKLKKLAQAKEAFSIGNIEVVTAFGHTLKGDSLPYGYEELESLGKLLEATSLKNGVQPIEISNFLDEIEKTLIRELKKIENK